MSLQAVLFDKRLNTPRQATQWLAREGLRPIKPVHTTDNFHRYRIAPPAGEMRTTTLNKKRRIKAIVMINPTRRGGSIHLPSAAAARRITRRNGGAIGSDLAVGTAVVGSILAGILGKKIYDHVRS